MQFVSGSGMTEMMVKDETFNVLVEGDQSAPVLMLAHPLGANLHIFDPLMPELLRRFRVVRYDARGHGESVVTPGPYTLDQLARDALGILDALGIEKAHWLGLSKGAFVGLALLTSSPERIGRAVLASAAAKLGNADMWNERIRTVRENGIESLAPSLLESWFTKDFRDRHPEEIERIWLMLLSTPAEGYAGASAALRDADLREEVGQVKNPVLVIVGRHDPVTTPGLGALVASAIQGAKLATIETAHISSIEDPEGFTGAAVEFLTAESPAMAEETMNQIVEDAAPEVAAEEETPELAQAPLPPKKPRKPRAPRKASAHDAQASAEMDMNEAPTATPAEASESEPEMESEAEPLSHTPPLAPARRRKPRKRREAAKLAAARASSPEIAIKPSQPRKRTAKKAAAKKSAARAPAKSGGTRARPAKKAAAKKAPAKKSSARRTVARKSVARKTVARKAVTRKAATRKGVARKAATRKSPVKKAAMRKLRTAGPARKAAVKKTAAKKSATRKSVAKRAPMRRAAAKKVVARKAAVKRSQVKKASVKKSAAKKTQGREAMPRRASGRRAASRKR